MSRFPYLFFVVFLLAACNSKENDFIDAETKRRIQLEPLVSLSEITEEVPSTQLAKQFLRLLEKEDRDLATSLKSCAIKEYEGNQGICDNYDDGDIDCALKQGFWKGTFAKHLRVAKVDLNNDQKPDYIFTGDNCSGFAGAYMFEYFVILSDQPRKHLAARFTATHVNVMPETLGDGKIIVEGISSYNGQSLNIWKLSQGRYIEDQCMWRDSKEVDKDSEFHRTPCQSETEKQK